MKTQAKHFFVFTICMLAVLSLNAQDTIVKNNGDIIIAKITEIGTNAISYKRIDFEDSPNFIENRSEIAVIKFKNGQKQDFTKENAEKKAIEAAQKQAQENAQKQTLNSQSKDPSTSLGQNKPVFANEKHKIESLNGKYTFDGQKIGKRELDRQLGKSKNPAVLVGLKTAKTTKVLQKVVGITSIPSTIAGGVTSLVTFTQFYQAYDKGNLTPQYYWNAGLSLLGTLTVPITSKILKKKTGKLYDKVLDLYNVTN
jgi:hypothetical protein